MYTKHDFSQVGLRKGYHADNTRAPMMTTDPISSLAHNKQLHSLVDTYKTRRGNVALELG